MKRIHPDEFDCIKYPLLNTLEKRRILRVLKDVKKKGDKAVRKWTRRFDGTDTSNLQVPEAAVKKAFSRMDKELLRAMDFAARNILSFAQKQLEMYKSFDWSPLPGLVLGQRIIPLKRVGIYVPGGRYPLFSSLLMGVLPAVAAGVEEVTVCTPPNHDGDIHPAILAAARMAGVKEIFKVGGIQAVAALAYGTESIKRVDMIVGPGNRYVTAAKKYVFGKVGIDFIAGPSEVMIVADRSADAGFIAADLIAQAEHDEYARPILVTDSRELADRVDEEIAGQLSMMQETHVARAALRNNGQTVLVENLKQALDLVNRGAPEHLEIHLKNATSFAGRVRNFGSLFIGKYSAEVLGDYSAGINHILPTGMSARYTGGLSVGHFLKVQTVMRAKKKGFLSAGPPAFKMAEAEGLEGHTRAVALRLNRTRLS
ncbi:MAG: histidinol dehydrogenase [Candidatus Aminicenantes bacterium]|nr:histidinol dehydrogenase [Candidatus Aminicenantes bacterium]